MRDNDTCNTSVAMRAFEFKAGSLCLDLVDTLSARGGDEVELLYAPPTILTWAAGAGDLSYTGQAIPTERDLARLVALREAIFRAASAVIDGHNMGADDIAAINAAAAGPAPRLRLGAAGMDKVADDPMAALRAEIATDAIAILGSARRTRLRRCGGCRMLFYDASPPGRRVWCSSAAGCGNRAKTKNRRARIAGVNHTKDAR